MTTKTDLLRNGAALLICLLMICSHVTAQNPACDFMLSLSQDTRLHFHSSNYAGEGRKGMVCRWLFICPEGYKCLLNCMNIRTPTANNCNGDRIMFSKTGDMNLDNAERVCKNGSLEVKSILNELVVGLKISPKSKGGEFDCSITSSIL